MIRKTHENSLNKNILIIMHHGGASSKPTEPKLDPSLLTRIHQGFHLEEGGGDFPLLLRHVSPATFDKFV